MSDLTPEMQFIKQKMKEVWSAGDFGVIANIFEREAYNFIDRLNIKPGSKLLDVACGSGNLSIPAAKLGAHVTGLDLVANLIEEAKERAKKDNLTAQFDVGDAESMPYDDNSFNYVVTMFGAMFCPRPNVAVNELLRVCKPGGTIAMANWTPEGFVGRFFKLGSSYVPPPPGVPAPTMWGSENIVSERFGKNVSDLKLKRIMVNMFVPMPPPEVCDHFIKYFGPTNKLYEMLDAENRTKFKNDFIRLYAENNISRDGVTSVNTEYLEVIASKHN